MITVMQADTQLEVMNSTLKDTGIYVCPNYELHYIHIFGERIRCPYCLKQIMSPQKYALGLEVVFFYSIR